jgi:hypothetical protein
MIQQEQVLNNLTYRLNFFKRAAIMDTIIYFVEKYKMKPTFAVSYYYSSYSS